MANLTANRLTIQRTSVSLPDDIDAPHLLSIELLDEPLRQTLARLIELPYLPEIAGREGTWIVETNETPRRSLAVVAQQWSAPRLLIADSVAIQDVVDLSTTPHIWFTYAGQTDPDELYRRLSTGGLDPQRPER